MKVEELRIGNWVSHRGIADIQITLLHFSKDYYTINRNESNALRPIPLTQEWLLKFGLIKNDYETQYTQNQPFICIELETKGWVIDYSKDFGWGIKPIGGINFIRTQYVHQLQNLYFALTGEELTIK